MASLIWFKILVSTFLLRMPGLLKTCFDNGGEYLRILHSNANWTEFRHERKMKRKNKMKLTPEQKQTLLDTLKACFERHMDRYVGLNWADVAKKLERDPETLRSLNEMGRIGGTIFDDRGYDAVWFHYNSAYSCYAARGFRGSLGVYRRLPARLK